MYLHNDRYTCINKKILRKRFILKEQLLVHWTRSCFLYIPQKFNDLDHQLATTRWTTSFHN